MTDSLHARGLDLRVSDAERDEAAELLREHCAEGRLSADELEERLGQVYAARTRGELDAPLRDLPRRPSRGVEPRNALTDEIAAAARHGWRVEWQSQRSAVLVRGGKPNHVAHAIFTFFTGGLWGIVWLIDTLSSREERLRLELDAGGEAHLYRL